MMKRGNEQEPKSGEILTTQEVARAFSKDCAIDRIVSVNVDRTLCRVPTEEQRAKTDEIVRQVSEASNKAKPTHFPWLEVFVAIAAVSLMIAAICFAIVMLAGGKS